MPEQTRGPGRPSKLNGETQKALLQGIQNGMRYEDACNAAGIHYNTLRNWIKKGEAAKSGEFLEFLEALKRAEARGQKQLLLHLWRAAGEGKWQAAAWILERRYPETYGRVVRKEVTGRDGGPVRKEVDRARAAASAERERGFAALFAALDAAQLEALEREAPAPFNGSSPH